MKVLYRFFQFFGGISFAIFLILSTALFVIAGTFIESITSSHRYAAHFTYQNPIFTILLWGFFFNILISAVRRWPFKIKHIPFLTTHLGLLMILGGTLIKSYKGIQGSMSLLEGSESQTLLIPETRAIQVTSRSGLKDQYKLTPQLTLKKSAEDRFPNLDIQLVGFAPHSTIAYESWVKGNQVFVQGLKPFEETSKVRIEGKVWDFLLFHDFETAMKHAKNRSKPTLIFVDEEKGTTLCMLDEGSITYCETFSKDHPKSLAVYDKGFGGYATFAKIPKPVGRAYAIYADAFHVPKETIALESSLQCRCIPSSPSNKLEENRPQITLRVRSGSKVEFMTLPFDPQGLGLKWPILDGDYLIRFQPEYKEIPYLVRLRQARQINYPLTNQPFSFESDLLITDKIGVKKEKTISMNNVYETWEGYRFYLANISPENRELVKRIQLVVNCDPAKYWMTYPGAFILSFGIVLLFWMRPYSNKRKS